MERKKFLRTAALAGLGAFVGVGELKAALLTYEAVLPPVGLQLFTLFGIIDKDVKGTLTKVAAIGYKELESAFSTKGGFYGMSAKEFSSLATGLGLKWRSHHVLGAPFVLPRGAKMPLGPGGKPLVIPAAMKNLRDNYKELIDQAAEGGIEYIVCATTPVDTAANLKSSIAVLNKSAAYASRAGLKFCYHNHDAEFKPGSGLAANTVPYDSLLADTDPKLVMMELDLAWVTKAGHDPVQLFRLNPGRFPLWHVKDISKDLSTVEPVGAGIIDFKRIFAAASVSGMKHFFVEHDMPKDAFASIEMSIRNLKLMHA